jgi:methylmalonyl-CoA mutase cobalamin-binding subunit
MTTGLVNLAGGLVVMAQLGPESTYWHFLGGLAVFGFGMALTSTPSTTAIVTSLPSAKQGVASAMNDVSRELGSALGIAILGSLFNSGYREAILDATAPLPPEAAHAVGESAGAGLAVASHLGTGGQQLATAVQEAFATGLGDAMVAGAVIAAAAAGFTAWRGPRHSRPEATGLIPGELDVDLQTIIVPVDRQPEPVG